MELAESPAEWRDDVDRILVATWRNLRPVRLGLGALEECRPMTRADERRRGTVQTLMGSVVSAVKRPASRGKKGAPVDLEDGVEAPDG